MSRSAYTDMFEKHICSQRLPEETGESRCAVQMHLDRELRAAASPDSARSFHGGGLFGSAYGHRVRRDRTRRAI